MANGFDDFTANPWAQMGLNIMAANRPGRSAGQAVSGGMLRGLMTVKDLQKDKERSKLRQTQAELQKAQLERLRAQGEQDARMRQTYEGLVGVPGGEQLEGPTRDRQPLTSEASGLYATDPAKAQILGSLPAKTGLPLMMNQEMDHLKMDQRAQQWQAEQDMIRPYRAAQTEQARANAALLRLKAANPGAFGSSKPMNMPSPTKQDLESSMMAVEGHPSLKELDDESKQFAAKSIAQQAKTYQRLNIPAQQAEQMAIADLLSKITPEQEMPWYRPNVAPSYNPYNSAAPAVAPESAPADNDPLGLRGK